MGVRFDNAALAQALGLSALVLILAVIVSYSFKHRTAAHQLRNGMK
jgi:hypothetical protein